STDWLKIKCDQRDEFIIVGFTDPAGQRHGFGALLLGYFSLQGELTYAGRVGTGFNHALLTDLRRRLDKLERRSPTVQLPKGISKKGTHWVEPVLVGEIRYGNRTTDGILRHPSFQGLREDKPPEEVVYDPKTGSAPVPADAADKPARARKGKAPRTPA